MNIALIKTLLLAICLFPLLAPSCSQEQEKQAANLELLQKQKWFFSNEEFRGDTVYFRPESYEFPRSRGREGFQFKEEDGKVTYYAISPADMPMVLEATWTYDDEILSFDIPGNEFSDPRKYQFKLLELNKDVMETIMIY